MSLPEKQTMLNPKIKNIMSIILYNDGIIATHGENTISFCTNDNKFGITFTDGTVELNNNKAIKCSVYIGDKEVFSFNSNEQDYENNLSKIINALQDVKVTFRKGEKCKLATEELISNFSKKVLNVNNNNNNKILSDCNINNIKENKSFNVKLVPMYNVFNHFNLLYNNKCLDEEILAQCLTPYTMCNFEMISKSLYNDIIIDTNNIEVIKSGIIKTKKDMLLGIKELIDDTKTSDNEKTRIINKYKTMNRVMSSIYSCLSNPSYNNSKIDETNKTTFKTLMITDRLEMDCYKDSLYFSSYKNPISQLGKWLLENEASKDNSLKNIGEKIHPDIWKAIVEYNDYTNRNPGKNIQNICEINDEDNNPGIQHLLETVIKSYKTSFDDIKKLSNKLDDIMQDIEKKKGSNNLNDNLEALVVYADNKIQEKKEGDRYKNVLNDYQKTEDMIQAEHRLSRVIDLIEDKKLVKTRKVGYTEDNFTPSFWRFGFDKEKVYKNLENTNRSYVDDLIKNRGQKNNSNSPSRSK